MLSEVEPIGGFAGISFSEPLLQGGILCSVVIYMMALKPWMALLVPALLAPQMIFVPLMQKALNRRAAARIRTLRQVSADIVGDGGAGELDGPARIGRVYALNNGIYRVKYSMNLLMNPMQYFAVAAALGIGGLFALMGRVEVGTVMAVSRASQALRPLGRYRELGVRIFGGERQVPAVRRNRRPVGARRLSVHLPVEPAV